MTSRERILDAMHLQEADRVPMSPIITKGWIAASGPERTRRLIKETDSILVVGVARDIPLGRYGEEYRQVTRDGATEVHCIGTPKGDLTQVIRRDVQTTWIMKHFFEDASDVEKFLSIPYHPPRPQVSEWRHWVDFMGEEGLVLADIPGAVMLPGSWYSPEDFMLNYALNRDLILSLVETANERILRFVQHCLDEGIRHFRIVGPELAAPPLMSPASFDHLILPFDSKVIDLIRSRGGVVLVHMHGAIGSMLEQVAALGANALDPLEGPPGGNVDLGEAKRRIGDRVCLLGNLDDLAVIEAADYDQLYASCQDCLRKAGAGGGYILGGTSSGLFTPRLYEQWLVMAEIAREIGSY